MRRTLAASTMLLAIAVPLPAAQQFEIQDQSLEGVGQIVSGMTHLAGVLTGRKYPGLKMVSEIHPGMGHGDVMGTSVVRGLRSLDGK